MSEDPVIVKECNEHVTTLTLNRPEKRNALNIQLMEKLSDAVSEAEQKPGKRVLIIEGAGACFCAGLDLVEAQDEELAHKSAQAVAKVLQKIAETPLVTIAAVHGAAIAGGAGLMAACDFAIVDVNCKIGFPEVKRGLVAGLIMSFILRQVSDRRTRELLILGDTFGPRTALSMGLVNRIAEENALEDEVANILHQVLECAPQAIAKTKELIELLGTRSLKENMQIALDFHMKARNSSEAQEGISAFLEKRNPNWVVGAKV